jgi:ribosomal protein S21|tara:strand:- start:235 stop:486 length:252 start_codon:yes stop_codon:yes gene_type:complete
MNKHEKRQKSILTGATGVKVVRSKFHPEGDITYALRSFKKEIKECGILDEFKSRRYHIPKSAKHREKMERAKYFQWVSDLNQD